MAPFIGDTMWSPTPLLSLTLVHVPLVSAFFTVSIIRHCLIAASALRASVLPHAEHARDPFPSPPLYLASRRHGGLTDYISTIRSGHDVAKVETNRDGPSWEIYGHWRKVRRVVRGCVGGIDVCYGGVWSKLLSAGAVS